MIWCAIALAIALLTGGPVVKPMCGVPSPAAATDEPPAPSPTRRPTPRPGATSVMGVATWYDWRPGEAAAGPAVRRAFGSRPWRGARVRVRYGDRTVVVRLTDWCACGPRNGVPTVIDLDRRSFAALAAPSRGVLKVEVIVP